MGQRIFEQFPRMTAFHPPDRGGLCLVQESSLLHRAASYGGGMMDGGLHPPNLGGKGDDVADRQPGGSKARRDF